MEMEKPGGTKGPTLFISIFFILRIDHLVILFYSYISGLRASALILFLVHDLWRMAMEITVSFRVNGKRKTVTTDADRPLLDVLREDLDLTGPKYGCGEGLCGACTIWMDGKKALSCVTAVAEADKKVITTIEGLAKGNSPGPVQQAFLEEGAMQCGYCTSGMIMAATALLEKNANPTDEEIAAGMNVNLCRCNGYPKIVKAVHSAAEKMRR